MDTLNPMDEKDDLTLNSVTPEQEQEKVPEPISEAEQDTLAETDNEQNIDTGDKTAVEAQNATKENDAESDPVSEKETQDLSADMTKQELCDRMTTLLEKNKIMAIKNEVEAIRQLFYKKSKAETDQLRAEFIENGGNELDFIPSATELEEEFKELLSDYRNRKTKYSAQIEKEKENNLLKKKHIIEQMKVLVESKEDVSSNITVFRQLQQDWKNTGPVPAALANELWRQYNVCQESFWDLIKINNELREYDFKKNLEAKAKLCEIAESLDEEKDVVSAFRQLQKLHEEWHELGPVAREQREQIWTRFKAASTVVNKKHQSHFDIIREVEDQNLTTKIALCERIEAIDISKPTTYKEWDDITKEILNIQEEWRRIGFAPKKFNQKIFERYRNACDAFFTAKAVFYKEVKNNLINNLEKKKELCEKAEALKDSTDWKETSDIFIQIQKEWKTIGPTPKRGAEDIWKQFIAACDHFFEQKNKNASGHRGEELQNLTKKKELIEKIKSFEKCETPGESLSALRALAAEWNSIGHVPFKAKDGIYKEYRDALDTQFDALNINASQRRLESFRTNLKDITGKGENKLYREREKLVRAYEHLKAEIATYDNNMGFLSISSKKGSGVLLEMERKIEALKEECRLLEKKIDMIDENI